MSSSWATSSTIVAENSRTSLESAGCRSHSNLSCTCSTSSVKRRGITAGTSQAGKPLHRKRLCVPLRGHRRLPTLLCRREGSVDAVHNAHQAVPTPSWRRGRQIHGHDGGDSDDAAEQDSKPYAIGIHGLISSKFANLAKMTPKCGTVEAALANMKGAHMYTIFMKHQGQASTDWSCFPRGVGNSS